jgi:hypothetical protein
MAMNSGIMVHMYFSLARSQENPIAIKISIGAESAYMPFHSPANSYLLVFERNFNFIIIGQHVSSECMCIWSICGKNKELEQLKSKI